MGQSKQSFLRIFFFLFENEKLKLILEKDAVVDLDPEY